MDGDGQILQRIQNLKILKSCERAYCKNHKQEGGARIDGAVESSDT